MGYYTSFELSWKRVRGEQMQSCYHEKPSGANFCPTCGKSVSEDLDGLISEYIYDNEDISHAITGDGKPNNDSKWYSHDNDMQEMSIVFPGILFTLHGEGEESGDLWKTYYLDGRKQHEKAKIIIGEFDIEKLK